MTADLCVFNDIRKKYLKQRERERKRDSLVRSESTVNAKTERSIYIDSMIYVQIQEREPEGHRTHKENREDLYKLRNLGDKERRALSCRGEEILEGTDPGKYTMCAHTSRRMCALKIQRLIRA